MASIVPWVTGRGNARGDRLRGDGQGAMARGNARDTQLTQYLTPTNLTHNSFFYARPNIDASY
jgi:hypothetical protein